MVFTVQSDLLRLTILSKAADCHLLHCGVIVHHREVQLTTVLCTVKAVKSLAVYVEIFLLVLFVSVD